VSEDATSGRSVLADNNCTAVLLQQQRAACLGLCTRMTEM